MSIEIDWNQASINSGIQRMLGQTLKFTEMKIYKYGQIDTIFNSIFPDVYYMLGNPRFCEFAMGLELFTDRLSLLMIMKFGARPWETLEIPIVVFV